jgi:lipoprotein-releasing system permease protein
VTDLGRAAQSGAGVHWFVAWRYLLARPRRLSGPILSVTALCLWVLMGFGLGVSWYPLADELISPFAVLPWWLLIGMGMSIALMLLWPIVIGVRYVLYSESQSAQRKILRWAFLAVFALLVAGNLPRLIVAEMTFQIGGKPYDIAWLLGGLVALWVVLASIAGALSMVRRDGAPLMLVVPIIAGLASLALFAVFDYFHRPYGSAGPAPIGTRALLGAGALGLLVVISTPLAIRGILRRREGRGYHLEPIPKHWARAIPALLGRYGIWGLLGIDAAVLLVLLVLAGIAVHDVLWPARGLVAGGGVLGIASIAGLVAGALGVGVALALRDRPAGALALRLGLLALFAALLAAVAIGVLYVRGLAFSDLPAATRAGAVKVPLEVNIPMLVALVLLLPTLLLAAIRYFFTFFSTVSIGGVAIGTMALVIVLSVMSGFESDLRRKILGSNAHILVTKASDDPMICKALPDLSWNRCTIDVDHAFTNYRAVGALIDETPQVIASSPYLISEVVIAANNNYANVIIKGVEPETVAYVSELAENIEGGRSRDPELLVGTLIERVDRLLEEADRPPLFGGSNPLDKLYPLSEEGEVIGKPEDQPDGGSAPSIDSPPIDPTGAGTDPAPSDFGEPDAGPDPDEIPGDLDLPEDVEPVDLSGPPSEPSEPSEPGEPEEIDIETEPLLPPDFDDPSLGLDDFGPAVTREGLHEAAREFTATIPPRVAILPGVLVGRELVKQINLYDGQEVKIVSPLGQDTPLGPVPRTKPFRVAGVFFTGMYEYDLKFIYVEVGALQDFLDLGDEVTGIEVRVRDPQSTDDVVAALNKRLGPEFEATDWKSLNRSLFSALKLEKIAMFLVLAIIILVASFSIVGNLIMVVIEKAREIAVLKTLGASDTGVMKIFVTQGFFIGLVGTGVGVALGLLGCWAGIRFGLPLDPDVYYIDKLPIDVDVTSVLLVAASGILISVVATLYPAYIAARLRPIRGLRYE